MLKTLGAALAVLALVTNANAAPPDTRPPTANVAERPLPAAPGEPVKYRIVTASERGTYIVLGRNLADYVAPEAGFELESVPSAGSSENVFRLRYEPNVKLALVQSDVYQAFLDQAAGGDRNAATIIRPLRVILPLYNEEIYFVVRADSPLNFIHEIQDARINAGPIGSGTALTTVTLYQAMFHAPVPRQNVTYLSNEDALVKLSAERSLDVVVIVGGQPMKLLADMKPEARQLLKLLKFDPNSPASREAMKTYYPATIRQASYPNFLTEDTPGLAVKSFLVTYDYNIPQTVRALTRFSQALCHNFPLLQQQGHPKWKDVDLALPDLGEGWSYYPPTTRQLRSCAATQAASRPKPQASCSSTQIVLGLCGAPLYGAARP